MGSELREGSRETLLAELYAELNACDPMGWREYGGEDSRNQMAWWASSPNNSYIIDRFFWLWKSNVLNLQAGCPAT